MLRFDWDPVPGTHFYRLWVKPGGTRYIAAGSLIPASVTHAEHIIPVHLTNWQRTRYVVTACNSAGCTHSATLDPKRFMHDTIGYIKASNTERDDMFGHEVVLSDDGRTLAVNALIMKAASATGVNGNQFVQQLCAIRGRVVFPAQRHGWRQDAYLKPPVNRPSHLFSAPLGFRISSIVRSR